MRLTPAAVGDDGSTHCPTMSRGVHPQTGYVYLAHFSTGLAHAWHNLGFATDLEQRVTQHRAGTGAGLMEVVKQAGTEWKLVRVWPGDRGLERRLKRRKITPRRLCPVCRGEVTYESVDVRAFLPSAPAQRAPTTPDDDPPF